MGNAINSHLGLLFTLYWLFAAYLLLRLTGTKFWTAMLPAILSVLPWFVLDWPDGRAGGYTVANLFLSGIGIYIVLARSIFQCIRLSIADGSFVTTRLESEMNAAHPHIKNGADQKIALGVFIDVIEQAVSKSRWAIIVR